MDREILKKEALKRMRKIGLMKECIDAFEKNKDVWVSEVAWILFNLSDRPEIKEKIKFFEEKNKALVYHLILDKTKTRNHLIFFYVARDKGEWIRDNEDLDYNHSVCYVFTASDPEMSEIGGVGFKQCNGGIVRTY